LLQVHLAAEHLAHVLRCNRGGDVHLVLAQPGHRGHARPVDTILPRSPRISSRSVPIRSWVAVMKTPVTPSPSSATAVTSSSTVMSRRKPKAALANTDFGTPQIHCHRSSWCGAWFTSTPPPSPPQVARQADCS